MTKDKPARHRRLHDFEPFDRIELRVVPRFKQSEISGSEWRYHVHVWFFFKGAVVHETTYRDMRTAMMLLPHAFLEATCPIPEAVLDIEKQKCDQVGCSKDTAVALRLEKLTSNRGEFLDKSESAHATYFRKFCGAHLTRGDGSREDADRNYKPLAAEEED